MKHSEYIRDEKKRTTLVPRSNYYAYIKSADWKEKSDKAKRRARWHCQLCNAPEGEVHLHAHHRTYDNLGEETANDLIVLCEFCHAKFHDTLPKL